MPVAAALLYAPCQVIRQVLVDLGLGAALASGSWPIAAGGEMDSPDDTMTVYDTQGTDDGRIISDGELQQHYGFQLRVRATDYLTGFAKASAVRTALSTVVNRWATLGGKTYTLYCFAGIGQVLSIGKDAGNTRRSLFTLNATAVIVPQF